MTNYRVYYIDGDGDRCLYCVTRDKRKAQSDAQALEHAGHKAYYEYT